MAKIEAAEQEVLEEIQTAVDNAETKMKAIGDPMDMFDHAYAEMPPTVLAHREELAAERAAAQEVGDA